ncbi:MAG: GNAT family N-acetyltransferase [Armatimonadota bacterium]
MSNFTYTRLTESNLPEALNVLNRNLVFDSGLTLDLLQYKTFEDPDYDPELGIVVQENDRVIGCAFGVVRREDQEITGGLKFIAVDAEFRNRGVATRMLQEIERRIRESGATSLVVGFTRPNYLMPGVDPRYTPACAFLLRRGFSKSGEAFNMSVELAASDWSTDDLEGRLAAHGITVRRLRADERDKLREWMERDGWSKGWQYQTLRAAEAEPPAVFIAERGGEFVAFACYDGVRPGWFGPMGTSEHARGLGIGSATFLKCLQDMKAKGYRVCEINSVGPLYFYSKTANATVSRVFWQFYKRY